MDDLELNSVQAQIRPRTASVLALLGLAAAVFSYLWAFCLTDALASYDVIAPITPSHDPRPRWFATSWFAMMILFMLVAFLLQRTSSRQMRSIDDMESADEA